MDTVFEFVNLTSVNDCSHASRHNWRSHAKSNATKRLSHTPKDEQPQQTLAERHRISEAVGLGLLSPFHIYPSRLNAATVSRMSDKAAPGELISESPLIYDIVNDYTTQKNAETTHPTLPSLTLPAPTFFANQTLLITGANTGVGLEAARHALRLRAVKVILGVRDLTKGEAARADLLSTTGTSTCALNMVEPGKDELRR
ncbi:hypothetical protein BP00DRAFT_456814 [Aspergillus indologenus CBS 114.80]|uniref:NAD(P)-binding protein n=1 Tax=Aspergillus indologenus CBS 114.80 TaxID=1450541 RepID=A0A2V5I967_9EURO|nr:hypothetical protein BP00DRAFT_456814 [Aspergillus indologenus CBS 114.80]